MTHDKLIGQKIGAYTLEAVLGEGGMAVVYRARNTHGDAVALKLLPALNVGQEMLSRFEREARTAAKLNHPAIVPIFEAGQAEGRPFIAMALIEGETLADRLAQRGRFEESAAIDTIWQIADALYYAHSQGIVHRDVKASNILLTDDGRALLADFGVARALDDPALTRTGHTVGTPAYMSPEQAAGDEAVDGRSHIYSLGVVLYQTITGRLPFQGTTPKMLHAHVYDPPPPPSTVTQVSPALEAVAMKALAKNPDDRFQTGAVMAHALTNVTQQTSIHPTQTAPPPLASRAWPYALAMVLIALASVGLLQWWQGDTLVPTETPAPAVAVEPTPTEPPPPSPTETPIPQPFPAGSLLKGTGDGVFRLNALGTLQHIYDFDTFLAFGFSEQEIQTINDARLDAIPEVGELTRLIQGEDQPIDWVVNGGRWRITRWQEPLAAQGHQGLPPSPADALLLNRLPVQVEGDDMPVGTFYREGDNFYLLFEENTRRRFADQSLLAAYGYTPEAAIQLPDAVQSLYNTGPPLTPVLQANTGGDVFLLEAGERYRFPSLEAVFAEGYGLEDVSQVPAAFLESFPLAGAVEEIAASEPTTEATTEPTQAASFDFDICSVALAEPFAPLAESEAATQLGCPVDFGVTTSAAIQPFEGGFMLWREDLRLIYVLGVDGEWLTTGDTWREGDPPYNAEIVPPAGLLQPVRGFGNVWEELPNIRDSLGWATSEETPFPATIQTFQNGEVWYNPAQEQFIVLLDDRSFAVVGE